MPYRNPFERVAVGGREEFSHPGALKAALAEFLATGVFVFAGEGSVMAYAKLTAGAPTSPAGLASIAIAHGAALFVAVAFAFNLSGGHVNPAVTLGLMMGGHITVFRSILYWIGQLVGAVVASLLLVVTTGGMAPAPHSFGVGESRVDVLVLEIVITFGLVFTVYAVAVDPRAKENVQGIAPLAIGLVVAANILVAGPFDGGSMNPARSFGPALVAWNWHHHWVYWVGPIVGGALAGVVYQVIFFPREEYSRVEVL
eukprot:c21721_g1_i1 orf=679-1446(+)